MTYQEALDCMLKGDLIRHKSSDLSWYVVGIENGWIALSPEKAGQSVVRKAPGAITAWKTCLDDFPIATDGHSYYDMELINDWVSKYHGELNKIERIK